MKLLSAITLLATLSSSSAFVPSAKSFVSKSSTQLEARKPFISGNWKLNPQTKDEAVTLASEIASKITADSPDSDVALFVPYVFIEAAMGAVGDKLQVGAEVGCYCYCPFIHLLMIAASMKIILKMFHLLYWHDWCLTSLLIREFALRLREHSLELFLPPCSIL